MQIFKRDNGRYFAGKKTRRTHGVEMSQRARKNPFALARHRHFKYRLLILATRNYRTQTPGLGTCLRIIDEPIVNAGKESERQKSIVR